MIESLRINKFVGIFCYYAVSICRAMIAEKDANRDNMTNFALRCIAGLNRGWKCQSGIQVRQYEQDGLNYLFICAEVNSIVLFFWH